MVAQQPTAVRLYAPDHPALALTLRSKLEQRIAQCLRDLPLASSWEDFKKRGGVIAGLEEALQVCSEVELDLSEARRG